MPVLAKYGLILIFSASALLTSLLAKPAVQPMPAQAEISDSAEPRPPAGQTYLGTKTCASCHFEKYNVWRQDKHAQAFAILPEKYRTDAACLKCHTTGFGTETGYKTLADSHLAGTSCEACHGPGSKHQEICNALSTGTALSAEQEKLARDSIYKLLPGNACIECHVSKAHQPHPAYDK